MALVLFSFVPGSVGSVFCKKSSASMRVCQLQAVISQKEELHFFSSLLSTLKGREKVFVTELTTSWSALANTHTSILLTGFLPKYQCYHFTRRLATVYTRCSLFSHKGWAKPINTHSWRRPMNIATRKIQTSTFLWKSVDVRVVWERFWLKKELFRKASQVLSNYLY